MGSSRKDVNFFGGSFRESEVDGDSLNGSED